MIQYELRSTGERLVCREPTTGKMLSVDRPQEWTHEEEEQYVEGMFAQAREAGLDMDDLANRMRARKETAMAELKGHPEIPAETRTFQGDDVDSAMADEPLDGGPTPVEQPAAR
jgi:hypothetical protein